MTLLISAVTRNHAFHASDRLLTFSRNRAIEEHDHRANKTIVVVGSDCWIVFGYTGVAYLDGKPTDQVIAEGIAGVSDLSQRMMLLRGNNQMKIHFWEIGNRTVAAVEPAFRRLPHSAQKHGLTLLGTALQFTRKRWRHIDFNMTFTPAGWTSEGDPGRNFSWNSYKLLSAGAVDPEIDRRMHERFTHEGVVSADRMRSVMVDAVRETGSGSPTVGENVISVVLAPLAREIGICFHQSENGPPIESPAPVPDRALPPAAVYTPYVLTPSAVFCPSAASVGGWSGDGLSLKFYGPPPIVGEGFMRSYEREPPPNVRQRKR